MTYVDDLVLKVKDLKIKAKNRRDLNRYEQAITYLDKALKELSKALQEMAFENENEEGEINSQFADCLGIKGGIYRRWALTESEGQHEKLLLSKQCYEEGYEYEKKGSKPNSYNMVNRLIASIFFEPHTILTPEFKINVEKAKTTL